MKLTIGRLKRLIKESMQVTWSDDLLPFKDEAYDWVGTNYPDLEGDEFEAKALEAAMDIKSNSEAAGHEPCEHCGSENTERTEPVPSMTGHGFDSGTKCLDCGHVSFDGPELGM